MRCPDCGVKMEKVPQLPSKAPFSKRFEEAVGQACESAAARQVARRFRLAASTVRAIDLRYLERWAARAAQAGAAADGRGRDLSGKEAEVPHGGEQSGDRRAAVVRPGAKKETLDEFFAARIERAAARAASRRPAWTCGSRSG